jgi:tetratricopeptide (TPR) repeat protein
VTQARAALGRSEDPAWWRVLLEAANRQNNGTLRLVAMEHLLESTATNPAEGPDADAGKLWEAYASHARAAANSHQLLTGDDANWLEFALRRRTAEPAEARAYLAWLARHARDPKMQQSAQAQLAADFAAAKLPHAGLRMFGAWPADAGALTAPTRHTLGALAETVGDHPRALQYRQGLPAPDNMPAAVWSLRLSALALRAGRADVAVGIARALAAEQSAISAAQLPEWVALAQQFTDHGLHDAAQALFDRILPHADAVQARQVLSGIARSHEARGQPLRAADFYLRAALSAPATDAAATKARLQAGFSLARAGLRDDAKAQFEWVMKNAGDPAQIAVARRELGF